jgi:hypothetical protein
MPCSYCFEDWGGKGASIRDNSNRCGECAELISLRGESALMEVLGAASSFEYRFVS